MKLLVQLLKTRLWFLHNLAPNFITVTTHKDASLAYSSWKSQN